MRKTNCAATMRRFGDAARKSCAAFLSAMLVVSALAPCALAAEVPDAVMPDEPVAGESAETEFKLVIDDSQIKVTAPTDVVFYVGADGDFTCPTNAYIENGSIFGIEMWGVEVTPETGASYELTVTPNGGSALSLAEEGLFVATDADVDEDWAGTTPTATDTMVRSEWSMAATDNAEDGTGKAAGADYIALTFAGRTDAADALSSGSATKVASAAWHFKAGGVAGDVVTGKEIVTTDDLNATPYAILTVDEAATATAGADRYAMTFVRSSDEVTTNDTYNGAAISEVYTGFEDAEWNSTYCLTPWAGKDGSVTSVKFENTVAPADAGEWFQNFENCISIDLAKLDASETAVIDNIFNGCSNLTTLDLPQGFGQNATNLSSMFYGCKSLTTLDLPQGFGQNATNLNSMFSGCSKLATLNFPSDWNTSQVENMKGMFYNCSSLALDCSGWDVDNVASAYTKNFNTNAPGVTAPTWVN